MINERFLNGFVVFDVVGYDEEYEMRDICNALSQMYKLTVVDKLEGPGATLWNIEISGFEFALVNNNWGTFLRPKNHEAIAFI